MVFRRPPGTGSDHLIAAISARWPFRSLGFAHRGAKRQGFDRSSARHEQSPFAVAQGRSTGDGTASSSSSWTGSGTGSTTLPSVATSSAVARASTRSLSQAAATLLVFSRPQDRFIPRFLDAGKRRLLLPLSLLAGVAALLLATGVLISLSAVGHGFAYGWRRKPSQWPVLGYSVGRPLTVVLGRTFPFLNQSSLQALYAATTDSRIPRNSIQLRAMGPRQRESHRSDAARRPQHGPVQAAQERRTASPDQRDPQRDRLGQESDRTA